MDQPKKSPARLRPGYTPEAFNKRGPGTLPGLIGLEIVEVSEGTVVSRLKLRPELLAPNGYLHAATVVALADTSAGYGTIAHLPEGASGFTTIELKSNFLGTLLEGELRCVATAMHTGRTSQVWDAVVSDAATGKTLALFRCSQMILWPNPAKA
ncbi:MAG: PaaI family thioesterase [Rhodospirillales bacterium]